jgi:uncharacterized protein
MPENQDTTIEFPCDFPIKIMGRASLAFEANIVAIVRKHSPEIGEGAFKIRHSKEGAYVSITATIPAKSKQQLDAIYKELTANKQVLMVL